MNEFSTPLGLAHFRTTDASRPPREGMRLLRVREYCETADRRAGEARYYSFIALRRQELRSVRPAAAHSLHSLSIDYRRGQDMARHWQFVQDERQLWHWEGPGDGMQSPQAFTTATECMLDAVRSTIQRHREQAEAQKKLLQ